MLGVLALALPTMTLVSDGPVGAFGPSGPGSGAPVPAAPARAATVHRAVAPDGAVTPVSAPSPGAAAPAGEAVPASPAAPAGPAPAAALPRPSSGPGATSPVPAPVTATTAPPALFSASAAGTPPPGVIGVSGGRLVLNGRPYTFTGMNAYELATDWGTNTGCGSMVADAQMDAFFAALPANSLVRFWAWQGSMATDVHTHQLNWAPLDRVFASAAAHGQRLVVVLAGQDGGCDDGHWKDPAWYSGGFRQVFDPQGLTPLPYLDYAQAIVNRYKSSPALGMWEPVSEPEASTCAAQWQPAHCSGHQTCPDEAAAAQALRYFFDNVGGEIHALDRTHLVEDGLIGSGQCGSSYTDYVAVSQSPGIDVLSYHDYYPDPTVVLPGDQWNGIALRLQEAAAIGKPIMGGEVGVMGGQGATCVSTSQRASLMVTKISGQMQAGSSGVLPWNWVPSTAVVCTWDVLPSDPILGALAGIPRLS